MLPEHLDRPETRDNKEIRGRKAPLGQLEQLGHKERQARPDPLALLALRGAVVQQEPLDRLDLQDRPEIPVRPERWEWREIRVLLGLRVLPALLVYRVVWDSTDPLALRGRLEIPVRPEVPAQVVRVGLQVLPGPRVLRGILARPVLLDLWDPRERRVWRGMLEFPDLQEILDETELPEELVLQDQREAQVSFLHSEHFNLIR